MLCSIDDHEYYYHHYQLIIFQLNRHIKTIFKMKIRSYLLSYKIILLKIHSKITMLSILKKNEKLRIFDFFNIMNLFHFLKCFHKSDKQHYILFFYLLSLIYDFKLIYNKNRVITMYFKKIIINIFLLLKIKVLKMFEIHYHLKYLFQNHIWRERGKKAFLIMFYFA